MSQESSEAAAAASAVHGAYMLVFQSKVNINFCANLYTKAAFNMGKNGKEETFIRWQNVIRAHFF